VSGREVVRERQRKRQLTELTLVDDAAQQPWEQHRPRLLSYVGRWGRAVRWLPTTTRVVLDIGAASGYGTAAVAAGSGGQRLVVGLERDKRHLTVASRNFSWLPMVCGSASELPFGSETIDAVLMLDILEHVAEPAALLHEVRRVLRPGGSIIVSVPHRGLLERCDSLNVYPQLRRRFPSWPPLDAADEVDGPAHRHFSLAELQQELGPDLVVNKVARTGTGITEIVHLSILLVARVLFRSDRLYRSLLALHLLVYLLDDMVPAGRAAYCLTVRAQVRPSDTESLRSAT
jgi:SAM-dependent methyltransferase